MYRYYYETMNRAERQVYTLMEEGLSAGASRVRVPHLGIVVLSDIFARLKLDVPRLCYIRTVKFRGVRDAEHVELIPEYGFDASGGTVF